MIHHNGEVHPEISNNRYFFPIKKKLEAILIHPGPGAVLFGFGLKQKSRGGYVVVCVYPARGKHARTPHLSEHTYVDNKHDSTFATELSPWRFFKTRLVLGSPGCVSLLAFKRLFAGPRDFNPDTASVTRNDGNNDV